VKVLPPLKTNRLLLAAGSLAALTATVHTLVGTAEIQQPLLGPGLPPAVGLLMYACWHLVTVTLVLSSAALLWSASPRGAVRSGALATFVSTLWLLFGVVFLVVALVFSGPPALLVLPQWVLLLPVGILGIVGSRRQAARVAMR